MSEIKRRYGAYLPHWTRDRAWLAELHSEKVEHYLDAALQNIREAIDLYLEPELTDIGN